MSRKLLTIIEAASGILSVIALIGNFVVDSKESKEQGKIGCDDNGEKK